MGVSRVGRMSYDCEAGACAPVYCCPPDITREDLGLPDTINASAGVEGSADGMPEDSPNGFGCDAGPASLYRWMHGSPFAAVLNGPYEFVEQTTFPSPCCFLYSRVGTYTPPECGGGITDAVEFGANPYSTVAIGDDVVKFNWTGSSVNWGGPGDPPVCANHCTLGNTVSVSNGTMFIPLPTWGFADLYLCTNGSNLVSITLSAGVTIPCRTYEDGCTWWAGEGCNPTASGSDCVDNPGCSANSGLVIATLYADLTGVPGVTLWDRIQNATFEGQYHELSCSCSGGGCAGDEAQYVCACDALPNCFCTSFEPGGDPLTDTCNPTVTPGDIAVDIPCLFSAGPATGTFA